MDTLTDLVVAEYPVIFVAVLEAEHTRIGMEAVSINGPEAYIGVDNLVKSHASAVGAVMSNLENVAF